MLKKSVCFLLLAAVLSLPGMAVAAEIAPPPDNMLRVAILNDDPDLVETAIGRGADVNLLRDDYTDNPLALAISRSSVRIARLLLQKGANPNVQVAGNGFVTSTPLLTAIMMQDLERVKLLLEMGADANLPSHKYHKPEENEFSPLIISILAPYTRESMDIFHLLLEREADINYTASDGYSVLMAASSGNYSRYKKDEVYVMAEILLKRGASLAKRNQRGENATDIALMRGFTELAALFNQERFKNNR